MLDVGSKTSFRLAPQPCKLLFPTWLCNEFSSSQSMSWLSQLLLGDGVRGKTSWNSMSMSHCCIPFTAKMSSLVRSNAVKLNTTVNRHLPSQMAVGAGG